MNSNGCTYIYMYTVHMRIFGSIIGPQLLSLIYESDMIRVCLEWDIGAKGSN